ncbi:MAG: Mpo1-like protein [Colwellia sp.]
MKSIEAQLARYKSVHLNQKNINTHFVGVPLIFLAVTLLLSAITFELTIDNFFSRPITLHLTLAMLIFSMVALYYMALHRLLGLGMLIYIFINLSVAQLLSHTEGVLYIALALFVIGWIIQFIGHYYEQAKPAFIDDLSQFLIGPLFLMAEVYFILGLESALKAKITPMALEKRRAISAN